MDKLLGSAAIAAAAAAAGREIDSFDWLKKSKTNGSHHIFMHTFEVI